MNPYLFTNPEVRAIACQLAKALADFDEKASAALAQAENRIAAFNNGAAHEAGIINIADHKRVAPQRAKPLPPATIRITDGKTSISRLRDVLDAMKPVGTVPGWQDIDADAPLYCAGLSGRMA